MYLSALVIHNFRQFGDGQKGLIIRFNKGVTALVGENDAGKLCIPVMLPTGSSDCDPPVLEVLPSHSSGCDPLRRRSCPIPKACRCVIART